MCTATLSPKSTLFGIMERVRPLDHLLKDILETGSTEAQGLGHHVHHVSLELLSIFGVTFVYLVLLKTANFELF